MTKKIVTRTTEIFLDDSGILRITVLDGVTIDIDDTVDNLLVIKQLSGGKPRLKLVDMRVSWKIKKEAREFLLSEDMPERTIARAVLVKSLSNKLMLNFLIKLNKPQSPLKIFTSEEEAATWLDSFR